MSRKNIHLIVNNFGENKRSKFCRFVAAIVAQISQKSMRKNKLRLYSVAFARLMPCSEAA